MRLTKEEKFLIKFYDLAKEKGDLYEEISVNEVAKATGMKEKALSVTMRMLSQANFVKKYSKDVMR
ncbi:MAG TPA: hypothetical protein P5048_01665 [Chlamydiales bacterium]|nr:hypothetical protein [Chlamydiales bacterium]